MEQAMTMTSTKDTTPTNTPDPETKQKAATPVETEINSGEGITKGKYPEEATKNEKRSIRRKVE